MKKSRFSFFRKKTSSKKSPSLEKKPKAAPKKKNLKENTLSLEKKKKALTAEGADRRRR